MVKRVLSLALAAGICAAAFTYSYADPVASTVPKAVSPQQSAEIAAVEQARTSRPVIMDGDSIDAAKEKINAAIAELRASNDLTAAGAEKLAKALADAEAGIVEWQESQFGQSANGIQSNSSYDNYYRNPAKVTPDHDYFYQPSTVPGPALAPKPTKLTIKLGKDDFTVDGENIDQERLKKIREKLTEGRVDLREGVTIELSPDGDTLTINGHDFGIPELQGVANPIGAPLAWALPEGGLMGPHVYTVPELSPEQREELSQALNGLDPEATKQWAEELRKEIEQSGVARLADPKVAEELRRELERNGTGPIIDPKAVDELRRQVELQGQTPLTDPQAIEELLQVLPHGELNLKDGWESDVESLSKQIKELVEQFIHEHESEASAAKDA